MRGTGGLELWENHASLIDAQEQVALDRTPLPVSVLNSYCTFDSDGAAGRQLAAELTERFGSAGVKFNFGGDLALSAQYQDHLSAWIQALPTGCRALCECHGGTVVEEPSRAAEIVRKRIRTWLSTPGRIYPMVRGHIKRDTYDV